MTEETKNQLGDILDTLKKALLENNVSMATSNTGVILFFDTDTYIQTGEMDGFQIQVDELVNV